MKKTIKSFAFVVLGCLISAALFCGCGKAVTLSDSPSQIFVEPIEGLSDNFICGVDISSVISLENSGVIFYDENKNEQDIFKTLAENGVNYVRVRVWNDPFDSKGNSYGGGGNDIETCIKIGERAAKYGIKLLVDFHYSDFWADPSKQQSPKAWADKTVSEKADACYSFTLDCLNKLKKSSAKVGMVQLGNEITTGMCDQTIWHDIAEILNAGARAVRKVSKDTLIAIHFTNPESGSRYISYANYLSKCNVDYDIFASSYYPYWHGTLSNLTSTLKKVAETYNKKVMVAETSYAYTFENGDFFANTISEETVADFPYPITVQGQANAIRDVAAAVAAVGENGLGIFYWEPAWISVGHSSYEENFALWEKYGSGWASSYSAEYDPKDAGVYYGGSSWDNQALFDNYGYPLGSLSVFRFLKSGAETTIRPDSAETTALKVRLGNEIVLPAEINVYYNDGSEKTVSVSWNTNNLSELSNTLGTHYIYGSVEDNGSTLTALCSVRVVELNYLDNDSFEEADTSMWKLNNINNSTSELYVIDKVSDAANGSKSLHFYSKSTNVEFTVEQTVNNLAKGSYSFSLAIQGGDAGTSNMYIYAISDGVTYTCDTSVSGWREFDYPRIENIKNTSGTITVGAYIKCSAGGWGTLDDFVLAPAGK